MNTLDQLNTLTLVQVRALASQQKIVEWQTESRGGLLRKLVQLSEEKGINLLEGEKTWE
jgi:hypothetical protein